MQGHEYGEHPRPDKSPLHSPANVTLFTELYMHVCSYLQKTEWSSSKKTNLSLWPCKAFEGDLVHTNLCKQLLHSTLIPKKRKWSLVPVPIAWQMCLLSQRNCDQNTGPSSMFVKKPNRAWKRWIQKVQSMLFGPLNPHFVNGKLQLIFMTFLITTSWNFSINNPFVGPSETMFARTQGGKLRYVITQTS